MQKVEWREQKHITILKNIGAGAQAQKKWTCNVDVRAFVSYNCFSFLDEGYQVEDMDLGMRPNPAK